MFRPAFRVATAARTISKAHQTGKRFASMGASKPSTWKGAALRWGAAGAIVYYYNTTAVFAEEPHYGIQAQVEPPTESEPYGTIETIADQRRAQARAGLQSAQPYDKSSSQQMATITDGEKVAPGSPGELEEEAEQQGAFNEETGEINWDCPCLGGMAHGPCGEQFRAAFSCFVYSKDEPKGVDCIEHFKTMQNCFREHPDVYGAELDDDEVAEVQAEEERAQAARAGDDKPGMSAEEQETVRHVQDATKQVKEDASQSGSQDLVPKAALNAK